MTNKNKKFDNFHEIPEESFLNPFLSDCSDDYLTEINLDLSAFSDLFENPDPEEDPIYGEIVSVSMCEDLICTLLCIDSVNRSIVLSASDYIRNGIDPREITPGRKLYYERPINFIDLI